MSHLEFPLLMFYSSQCVFHFLGQVYSRVFYFGGGGRGEDVMLRGCFFFLFHSLYDIFCVNKCSQFVSAVLNLSVLVVFV